jgi:hypothetical protein
MDSTPATICDRSRLHIPQIAMIRNAAIVRVLDLANRHAIAEERNAAHHPSRVTIGNISVLQSLSNCRAADRWCRVE